MPYSLLIFMMEAFDILVYVSHFDYTNSTADLAAEEVTTLSATQSAASSLSLKSHYQAHSHTWKEKRRNRVRFIQRLIP